MNKSGIEFTFNWIFSIIVGAVVIFLAIYAATSFIKTEKTLQDTQTVQDLETILNPLQTSVESINKPSAITFPMEVQISTRCDESGILGTQSLTLKSKSSIGGAWSSVSFPNQVQSYLFMASDLQGTSFNAFTVPFSMPYKVSDLVVFWQGNYCFVDAPGEIKDNIQILNNSIQFVDSKSKCSAGSKSVCFINSASGVDDGCTIKVNTYIKQVRASGKVIYYEDSLIYPAIFADASIYECNVKRLVSRAKYLAEIYSKKSEILGASEQCGSSLSPILKNYASSLSIQSSRDLNSLFVIAKDIKSQQGDLLCAMWK